MKMERRFPAILAASLFVFAGIAALPQVRSHQLKKTDNAATRTLQLAGLRDKVTVRRDERGIPYIEAKNDEDLYLAQGYVTASDRLWQMDLFRRTARGELAEVLGNGALEEDKRHRTFGFAQEVEAELGLAAPRAGALLEAYAKGVNAYISSLNDKTLPPEFQILQYWPRPWTPADSLFIVKLFYETLSSTWRLDLMREALAGLPAEKRAALLPETSPLDVLVVGKDNNKIVQAVSLPLTERSNTSPVRSPLSQSPAAQKENAVRASQATRKVTACRTQPLNESDRAASFDALIEEEKIEARSLARVGLYADALAASNNWVVSGKRTASGKPLLANDPHLAPSAPSIWYLVHLTAPGVRVAGVTSPGLPGVVIGHNDHIAWGFTNVGPDVQDLYVEKFDPSNPQRYQTPSGWRDAETRHEVIKVRKGFTDAATDAVTLDVTVTRHGPIVFEREGKRYALRWTALDPKSNKPDITYLLNRARNWREFSGALRSYTGPTQNIVYADVEGHIGYYAAGVVPVRKSGDGSVPYDGATDDGEWASYIPFDKLPHLFDPQSGIIVTANQRIVGTDYPYFLTHSWAQPYRARRILTLLNEKQKVTADDFRTVQGDTYSLSGTTFAREVSRTLRRQLATAADDKLLDAVSKFESWDGRLNVDSVVAPVVAQMRIAFRSRIINEAVGEERAKIFGWGNFDTTLDRIITDQPSEWLPKKFKTYADFLRVCYDDARQALTKSLGADESQWTWGNMVKVRFPHPLASAPLIGLQFAISPFPQRGTGGFLATVNVGAAVSMRFIADPSDWDKTQHGIALGESGIPTNAHWSDQLADWRAVTPRVFPYNEGAIAKAVKETLVLEPAAK